MLLPSGPSLQSPDSPAVPNTHAGTSKVTGCAVPCHARASAHPGPAGSECTCPSGVSCLSCQEAGSYPGGPEACNHNTAAEPGQAPARAGTTRQTEQLPWISSLWHQRILVGGGGGVPKSAAPHLRSHFKHPCLELEWLRMDSQLPGMPGELSSQAGPQPPWARHGVPKGPHTTPCSHGVTVAASEATRRTEALTTGQLTISVGQSIAT